MSAIVVYIIFSIFWGLYATTVNICKFKKTAKPIASFVFNTLFCPVSMVWATIDNFYIQKDESRNRKT